MGLAEDVQALKSNPSLAMKSQITKKVADYYDHGLFADHEKGIAEELIAILAKHREIEIRKILSESLKNNKELPKEIVLNLAWDIDTVSEPILQHSLMLSQEDLIEIVHGTKSDVSLKAIAKRKDVQEPLAEAIVDTRREGVVEVLVNNADAKLSEKCYEATLEYFSQSDNMLASLVKRGHVPAAIVEKVIARASESLRQRLVKEEHVDPAIAKIIAREIHDKALMRSFETEDFDQCKELVEYLYKKKKLDSSIAIRGLCAGNLTFFELAIAVLATTPYVSVHEIVLSNKQEQFAPLYKKAKLPEGLFDALYILLNFIAREVQEKTFQRKNFANHIIELIMYDGYDETVPMMKHLMALISSKDYAVEPTA